MSQTLYFGGDIVTLVQPFYAEAVLCEDGRIAAVGTLEKLRGLAPKAREYDLKGATLLPAFLDPQARCSWRPSAGRRTSRNWWAGWKRLKRKTGRIRKGSLWALVTTTTP